MKLGSRFTECQSRFAVFLTVSRDSIEKVVGLNVHRFYSRHVVNASGAILQARHPSIFIFGAQVFRHNRFVGCHKSWVCLTFTHPRTRSFPCKYLDVALPWSLHCSL